jgi:hypothetical protein
VTDESLLVAAPETKSVIEEPLAPKTIHNHRGEQSLREINFIEKYNDNKLWFPENTTNTSKHFYHQMTCSYLEDSQGLDY